MKISFFLRVLYPVFFFLVANLQVLGKSPRSISKSNQSKTTIITLMVSDEKGFNFQSDGSIEFACCFLKEDFTWSSAEGVVRCEGIPFKGQIFILKLDGKKSSKDFLSSRVSAIFREGISKIVGKNKEEQKRLKKELDELIQKEMLRNVESGGFSLSRATV